MPAVTDLPKEMNAVVQTNVGGPEVLAFKKLSVPKPGPRDVLVKNLAVSVNPVDYKLRTSDAYGKFEGLRVLGYDSCGIVVGVGGEVQRLKVGDEVIFSGSSIRPGTDAEYTAVDERIVGHKPKSMSPEDAAGLPLVSLTAWEALIEKMNVPYPPPTAERKKTLLIINGAGGVGSMATQLASKILNLTVISTASRPETKKWCLKNGADHVINHREPLTPQLDALKVTPDYILICYDTSKYIQPAVDIAAPLGHICSIVETDKALPFIGNALSKALSFTWEFMFAKPIWGVDLDSQGRSLDLISKWVDEGKIESIVTEKVPLNVVALRKVHEKVQSGKAMGKLTLVVGDKWE